MCLNSREFLERHNVKGEMQKTLRHVDYIVSSRDIMRIAALEGKPNMMGVVPIRNSETTLLLRGVRNKSGKSVYGDADIYIGLHDLDTVYSMQSFACHSKLVEISRGIDMFHNLGMPPIFCAGPSLLTYKNMAAIVLPPVVEVLPKNAFDNALQNLKFKVRLPNGASALFNTAYGVKEVNMAAMLECAQSIIESNKLLPVIRDGTHRMVHNYTARSLQGNFFATTVRPVPLTVLRIYRSSARAHSIPIRMEAVVKVKCKPESQEQRYPGFVEMEMEYFKGIGVDG